MFQLKKNLNMDSVQEIYCLVYLRLLLWGTMVKDSTLLVHTPKEYRLNYILDYSKGYVLEKLVKLKKEISIIITRFSDQQI